MDSFELNKILGAILGTLLFVMGVGFLAEAIYHPITGNGPGYALPAPEEGGEQGGGEEVAVVSIGTLLASADPVQGADQAKKCAACHDLTEANTNKTGPGLYDVVERVIGSHPGFAYSQVLADHQANGDIWSYDNLNHFLTSPKGFAPGTKMTFAGVKNDQERANIIAFLSTLSASPKPFPPAEVPADAAAPAEQTVDATESTAPADVVETPEGTVTSTESAPATGATTETPAGGGEGAVAEPVPEASAVSSEAPAAASEASAPSSAAQ